MSDDRIELESRYTFLERTVSELNDVVYSQQKQIDQLQAAVKHLSQRLEESVEGGEPPASGPPPHY